MSLMNPRIDIDISERKLEIFERDGWQCCFTGCKVKENLQMAHIIPLTKERSQKFVQKVWFELSGKEISIKEANAILNHPLNARAACSAHNSFFSEPNNEIKQRMVVKLIYYKKKEDLTDDQGNS